MFARNSSKKIIIIAHLFSLFLLFFSFEAKADLVDDFIKENKLDPMNKHYDQCFLMNNIYTKILNEGSPTKENSRCLGKICLMKIPSYVFDKNSWWYSNSIKIIFRSDPYKILGNAIDGNDLQTYKNNKNFNYKTMHWIDLSKHKNFSKAEFGSSEFCKEDGCVMKKDGKLRLGLAENIIRKDISYVKSRGCYIDEFNIMN